MIRVKLCIREEEYLRAFINYVSMSEAPIYLEVCNSTSDFEHGDSIILTDLEDFLDRFNISQRSRLIILSSRFVKTGVNLSGAHVLFKYKRMSDIISELMIIYSEIFQDDYSFFQTGSDLISICSVEELEYSETQLTQFIARQITYCTHKDVLIIPCKHINTYAYAGDADKFSKMMYYIQEKRELQRASFFYNDEYGVSYFKLHEILNPIVEMDDEIVSLLISEMMKLFPIVILDVGDCLNLRNLRRIEKSSLGFCFSQSRLEPSEVLPINDTGHINMIRLRDGIQKSEMNIVDILRNYYGINREDDK